MSKVTLIDYLAEDSGMTPYWVYQALVHGHGMLFKTEAYWLLVKAILKRELGFGVLEHAVLKWAEENPEKLERRPEYEK